MGRMGQIWLTGGGGRWTRVRAPQFAPFAALTGREEDVVGEEIANLANLADLAGGGLKRDKKGIG